MKKNKFQKYKKSPLARYYDGTSEVSNQIKTMDKITGVAGGVMGLAGLVDNNLSTPSVDTNVSATSRNDLFNQMSNFKGIKLGRSNGLMSGISGATTGASAGAAFGGAGAAIGAGVGLLSGVGSSIFGNAKKRRAERRANAKIRSNFSGINQTLNEQDLSSAMANYSACGGKLKNKLAYGGNFDTGLTLFNQGGTHEENSNGGVLQGFDENGVPNFVEQGETKWKNYIFSDRLKPDKELLTLLNIKGSPNSTFAAISKQLSKEIEERELDPIARRTFDSNMAKLSAAQEVMKVDENANNIKKYGGFIRRTNNRFNLFPNRIESFANGGNLFAYGDQMSVEERKRSLLHNLIVKPYSKFRNNIYKNIEEPLKNEILNPTGKAVKSVFVGESQEEFENRTRPISKDDSNKPTIDVPKPKVKSNNTQLKTFQKAEVPDRLNPIQTNLKGILTKDLVKRKDPVVESKYKRGAPSIQNETAGLPYGQFAPAIANAASLMSDIFSKPEVVTGNYITPERVDTKLDYKPFDREYGLNKLMSNINATRSAITNNSNGNRGIALAGLSKLNRSSNEAIGDVIMKTDEFNQNKLERVKGFNRSTDQFNAQSAMNASQFNAQLKLQLDDINSRNRAAKRNAVRDGINNVASNISQISQYSDNLKSIENMFDYDRLGNFKKKGGKLKKK